MRPSCRFILVTVALLGLSPWLCAQIARLPPGEARPPSYFGGFETTPGEPFALAGRRIVFTSWHHVAPGDLTYLDEHGKTVYASESAALGPGEARLVPLGQPRGVRLAARPAEHVGPVLASERPWEAVGVTFLSVMQDEGKLRGWGFAEAADGMRRFCYVESLDGIHWTRPDLGLVPFGDTEATNLLPTRGGAVFRDPTAAPGQRYKWVAYAQVDAQVWDAYRALHPEDWEPRALLLAEADPPSFAAILGGVSADGYAWNALSQPLVVEMSDTFPVCTWDPWRRAYTLYTRQWSTGRRSTDFAPDIRSSWSRHGRRAIGMSVSKDFSHFPPSRTIVEPWPGLAPTESLYTNARTAFPGAPDHQLMFPAVWDIATDRTRIVLMSSHDGDVWSEVPESTVLQTSEPGTWDGGCLFACPDLVETPDGDLLLPYQGYVFPHKYPRGSWSFAGGMARWRHGRLAAVEADGEAAFQTVSFVTPGATLRINAVAQEGGYLRVEIDGIEGRGFEDCDPIVGDQAWTAVTWRGEPGMRVPAGAVVVLKVRLDKAAIYGFQFDD